jgi:hypothetical protein
MLAQVHTSETLRHSMTVHLMCDVCVTQLAVQWQESYSRDFNASAADGSAGLYALKALLTLRASDCAKICCNTSAVTGVYVLQ